MDNNFHYEEPKEDSYDDNNHYGGQSRSDSPDRRSRGKRDRRRNSRDYSSSRSRSRSQSRSPEPRKRDRGRSSPDRWRHDMYQQRNRSEERPVIEPNSNLIVKGLPLFMEESQLWKIVKDQGFAPRDVRILKHKDTGQSRGFGFVEFCNVTEATSWMEHTKGRLKVDDRHYVDIQYTTGRVPSSGPGAHGGRMIGDWICSGCNMNNFKKRDNCFKCGITREESERNSQSIDGFNEIGVVPCDTILLRDLPASVTEDKIISALRQVTTLEPIRLILAKHPQTQQSRGYAYVQMRNVQEATQLLTTLTALTKLTIDAKDALVSYAKMSLTTLLSGPALAQATEPVFNPSDISNSAAAVAQNAIRKAQAAKQLQQIQLAQQLAQQQGQLAQAGFMLQPTTNVQLQQLMAAQALQEQLAVAQVQAHVQMQQMQAQNTAAILSALQRNPGLSLIAPGQLAQLNALQGSLSTSQAGFSLNPLMTATLAGTSGLSVGGPDKLGTVVTPHGEFPKFPPPDTSKFQLEESSGYYYDPTTNFYYDPKSQYYFNSVTQKWVYWDPNFQTYLPADDSKTPDGDRDDKGGLKKDKVDKVKVAKKIQKDMEKWAKTLNQKKEHKPTSVVSAETGHSVAEPVSMSLSNTHGKSSGTADAGFFILEGRMKSSSHSVFQNNDGSDDEDQMQNPSAPVQNEKKPPVDEMADLIDWSKLACLLCKRAFNNRETLVKHTQMSDLHKKNMEEHMKSKAMERELERQSTELQYRDRAKERREKFGLDVRVHPDRLKEKYMESRSNTFEQPTATGIASDNIGNKLLKSMGWNEGQGLGRANQGIVDPINAERRIAGAGLGTAGAVVDTNPSANYQESLRAAMRQRYMANNH